jgi:hypothetical protein
MSLSSVVHVAPEFFGSDAVLCGILPPYESALDLGSVEIGQTHRAIMRVACRTNVPGLKPDILNETRMFIEVSDSAADMHTSISRYGTAAIREFEDSTFLQLVSIFQVEILWTPTAHAPAEMQRTMSLRLMYPDRKETLIQWSIRGETLSSG